MKYFKSEKVLKSHVENAHKRDELIVTPNMSTIVNVNEETFVVSEVVDEEAVINNQEFEEIFEVIDDDVEAPIKKMKTDREIIEINSSEKIEIEDDNEMLTSVFKAEEEEINEVVYL
jgi:hypothetical protein